MAPRAGFPAIEPPRCFSLNWDGTRGHQPRNAEEATGKRIYEGPFVNNYPHAAAIVAVVDFDHGEWTAYMGGADPKSEDAALLYVALHGVKLPKHIGCQLFPELPADRWRY